MKSFGVLTISCCVILTTSPSSGGELPRFERSATLPWHLPFCPAGGSPWSPTENLLAVDSAGVLAVFDASRPQSPPKTGLAMPTPTNITVSWSPDGQWIACETKTYSRTSGRPGVTITDTLWAIPVAGGRPIVILGAERWPFLWGSDEALYSWDRA